MNKMAKKLTLYTQSMVDDIISLLERIHHMTDQNSGKLDFSALTKALTSLERAVTRAAGAVGDEELRDAVIQRFEYSYELCWKMLKRQLESEAPNPAEIDTFSFKQLIREGAEKQLLTHPEQWFAYREQHNITSHTYDQKKAQSVYETAQQFLPDAQQLLAKLSER